MNRIQKKRLKIISIGLVLAGIIIGLFLYALRHNINLFFSPEQIVHGDAPLAQTIRIGGMVTPGSIIKGTHSLKVVFDVHGTIDTIHVAYRGVLPTLFRDGQGVVATGYLKDKTHFVATEILAKHDERYMPKWVSEHVKS